MSLRSSQPAASNSGTLGGLDEGRMRRGQAVLLHNCFGRAQQRRGIASVLQQQARAGRRGERRGDLQLGIIIAARPVPGIGPGMVEHIFALAVRLADRRAARRAACHRHLRSRIGSGLQPVPGPTLPESSSAVRKAWLMKGIVGAGQRDPIRPAADPPTAGAIRAVSAGSAISRNLGTIACHAATPAPSAIGASALSRRAVSQLRGVRTVQLSSGMPSRALRARQGGWAGRECLGQEIGLRACHSARLPPDRGRSSVRDILPRSSPARAGSRGACTANQRDTRGSKLITPDGPR